MRKKEAGIHAMSGKSRLAEALVDWMKQAEERGVYLEYRFSGAAPAPVLCEADGKLLGEIGSVVSTMLDACGRLPEAERWMSLEPVSYTNLQEVF